MNNFQLMQKRLDKSGTTMNVALQLAYYMNYEEVYIIGM
jgi:hypothetical protein